MGGEARGKKCFQTNYRSYSREFSFWFVRNVNICPVELWATGDADDNSKPIIAFEGKFNNRVWWWWGGESFVARDRRYPAQINNIGKLNLSGEESNEGTIHHLDSNPRNSALAWLLKPLHLTLAESNPVVSRRAHPPHWPPIGPPILSLSLLNLLLQYCICQFYTSICV